MDYSEAESHFYDQRQHHLSPERTVLTLYEQLTVVTRSARYTVLQNPESRVPIKKCLDQALRLLEEIQRLQLALTLPESITSGTQVCYGYLGRLFAQETAFLAADFLQVHEATRELLSQWQHLHAIKKRRRPQTPPLNVKRKL